MHRICRTLSAHLQPSQSITTLWAVFRTPLNRLSLIRFDSVTVTAAFSVVWAWPTPLTRSEAWRHSFNVRRLNQWITDVSRARNRIAVNEMARRKRVAGQMTWWPSRTIIYCNSAALRLKERESEVAWHTLPLIRLLLATPPITYSGWQSAGCEPREAGGVERSVSFAVARTDLRLCG